MLTRRDVLLGAAFAATAPRVQTTPVTIDVPPGACDCHIHVIGDTRRFPMAADRVYTPATAPVEQAAAFHRALRTTRTVVVQPSFYGTDNACTLDALARLGAGARGVAVIDERTPDSALDAMRRAGVRGIRINLETVGQTDPNVARQRLQAATARMASRGWHVQVFTRPTVIERLEDLVARSPVPIVFDHFGGTQAADGPNQPGFLALVRLVQSGHAYVKISGAYRVSTHGPDYPDVAPLAKALIAANSERILWGSDWPHVDSTPSGGRRGAAPHLRIDDGRLLNQLGVWAPDAAVQRKILIENPARLYGW